MAMGLAGTGNEQIDTRFQIMCSHTGYEAGSKDDPMGLALLGHTDHEAPPVRPGYEPAPVPPSHPDLSSHDSGAFDQHMDAMGSEAKGQR